MYTNSSSSKEVPNISESESESKDKYVEDNSNTFSLDLSDQEVSRLSERARKSLKSSIFHSKSFYANNELPFTITLPKTIKQNPYTIKLRTFSRSKELIVTNNGSGKKVLFLVSFHPLRDAADPTVNGLSELIEDLYIMASHRSNLTNKDKISGRISGIGFRRGYEKGKTAGECIHNFWNQFVFPVSNQNPPVSGTYAIQKNLKPAQVALDRCLQTKLPDHNKFISDCIRHFSHEASKTNAKALKEFGMPSWLDKQWEDLKKYNPQPIASSVIVTSNDFSNSAHFNKDENLFTYRIFSYINKFTGTPILPPSHTLGHAICFPDYDCNINFGGIPGIIEVLWKSNDITHHTIGTPEELKTTKGRTHFGCSFQISCQLATQAIALQKLPEEERKKRIMTQDECDDKRRKNAKC
jgi:hypothetical protein